MHTGRTRPALGLATKRSPSRDFALQRYVHLSNQKDSLQSSISRALFSSSSISPLSPSSPTDPFAISPNRFINSPSDYHGSISSYLSASQPTEPMSFPTSVPFVSNNTHDEERLADINHQIKATLTELLNHDDVKQDDKFRHWVQERLMESELETKMARRRSRRRSSIDHEAVNSIAEHIRAPDIFRFGATL